MNFVGGAAKPTELVQEFQQTTLAPLLSGQQGATAEVQGTSQLAGGPQMSLQPRSFNAVNQLVNAGHEADMARIDQRNRIQALAKSQAASDLSAKGIGGVPYNYATGRQTYTPQTVTPYAQQQTGGTGGFGGHSGLQPAASSAFDQMQAAYARVFGGGIPIVDGWRSYQKQVEAWTRYQNGTGPRAAQPGTSVHGHGLAADFGGAIQNAGSAQHRWLAQNGQQFGWYWVGQQYGEPWHFEYHPEWR
jgi:LAS superfamily LD-carboxypeptidase LdcB